MVHVLRYLPIKNTVGSAEIWALPALRQACTVLQCTCMLAMVKPLARAKRVLPCRPFTNAIPPPK